MTGKDLDFFRQWFLDYAKIFHVGSGEDIRNISLKELHTSKVCENMRLLVKDPEVKATACFERIANFGMIAESVALFHDVGRFRQYAEHRTFQDAVSVNHAVLGAGILSEKKILSNLSDEEQESILHAVKFHNAFKIPDISDICAILLLKLIRDADKLDIWRVFLEYYESPADERASAVGLGLTDSPEYSKEVLACIAERRVATLTMMRTLNDFKLLQLSWIYDLNFKTSLKLLMERDYISKVIKTLPQTDEIGRLPGFLREYIEKRLRDGS